MSDLKKYECTVLIDASFGVTVEASSPEEAAELAENAAAEQGAGSLCHQCSNHTECGDCYAVIVYEDDKEILDTDHRSKLLADAQSQLAALREELERQTDIAHAATVRSNKLEQRLADAERRNAELAGLLHESKEVHAGFAKDIVAERRYQALPGWMSDAERHMQYMTGKIDASLKPTESGASE